MYLKETYLNRNPMVQASSQGQMRQTSSYTVNATVLCCGWVVRRVCNPPSSVVTAAGVETSLSLQNGR